MNVGLRSIAVAAAIIVGAGANALAADRLDDALNGLRHPLAAARIAAAEAAGDLGPAATRAIGPLLAALWDDNVGVRRAAIGSLSHIGVGADGASLIVPSLGDHDWMVRERAAKLLAGVAVRDAATIEPIVDLLKSVDWRVRRAAAVALAGARPDQDAIYARMLIALSDRVLNDDNWQVRVGAVHTIGKQGPNARHALPDLFDVLRYDEPGVAEAAIEAIGRVGPAGLDMALMDSFPSVRLGAARIVAALGSTAAETTSALAKAMNERSIAMRKAAALALGAVGPSASGGLTALVDGLKDADWSVRWASARALGKLGSVGEPATIALAAALRDPDTRVCEAAAFALEGIGMSARDSIGALTDVVRDQSFDSCKMIDVAAASQDAQMDLGWTVRWAAARALGEIHADPDRTVAALQGALIDSMWQVRGVAALSLGNVRTPASVKALSGALSDEVSAVRKAAAVALGTLGPNARAALPELRVASSDPDQTVREAALDAVNRIGVR